MKKLVLTSALLFSGAQIVAMNAAKKFDITKLILLKNLAAQTGKSVGYKVGKFVDGRFAGKTGVIFLGAPGLYHYVPERYQEEYDKNYIEPQFADKIFFRNDYPAQFRKRVFDLTHYKNLTQQDVKNYNDSGQFLYMGYRGVEKDNETTVWNNDLSLIPPFDIDKEELQNFNNNYKKINLLDKMIAEKNIYDPDFKKLWEKLCSAE